jgi:hypothetical protein
VRRGAGGCGGVLRAKAQRTATAWTSLRTKCGKRQFGEANPSPPAHGSPRPCGARDDGEGWLRALHPHPVCPERSRGTKPSEAEAAASGPRLSSDASLDFARDKRDQESRFMKFGKYGDTIPISSRAFRAIRYCVPVLTGIAPSFGSGRSESGVVREPARSVLDAREHRKRRRMPLAGRHQPNAASS